MLEKQLQSNRDEIAPLEEAKMTKRQQRKIKVHDPRPLHERYEDVVQKK